MPIQGTSEQGLGGAAKQVAEHASALARLELELAALELKTKVSALGVGIGLALGAVLFLLFAIGFLLATAAAALAIWLPTWAALLIVGVVLLVLVAVLGAIAARSFKKGTPPVPQQAIEEAKLTGEAIKSDGRR
jgi:protein-S-isoprenylcysteine O-methyltransferase Ste14